MSHYDVIVAGAGASGVCAAIYAARAGASCVIFEKQKAPLRKLLASGNGQCNITNRNLSVDHYHGSDIQPLHSLFSRFNVDAAFDFYLSVGLNLREKPDGRIYPWSMQSSTVERALCEELRRLGVETLLHRKIVTVTRQGKSLLVETEGHERFSANALVIACGSRAYKTLGASSDVYDICRALGHTLVEPLPSLLPLTITQRHIRRLEGTKWDCRCVVFSGNRRIAEAEGELLFTKYGISGPVVIDISGPVNRSIHAGFDTRIEIDFFPTMNENELCDFLAPVFSLYPGNDPVAPLDLVMKKRMAGVLLENTGADSLVKAAHVLKHYPLTPDAPRSFDEAMVCAGGIPLQEVDTKTFQSKKAAGVFVCGEILDVDGDCGGYNLHFAWASGAAAGTAAATSSSRNPR